MTGPDAPQQSVIDIARDALHVENLFREKFPWCEVAATDFVARQVYPNHRVQLPFAIRLVTVEVRKRIVADDPVEARLCIARARLIMNFNGVKWADLFVGGVLPPPVEMD